MNACLYCGKPVKRKGNKYCCYEHAIIHRNILSMGAKDYDDYLRMFEAPKKCPCCGQYKPLKDFRKNRDGRGHGLELAETCSECRESGRTWEWTASLGSRSTVEKHVMGTGLTVDKYGKMRKMITMSGHLEVECFDPRMVWEPSPAGVAG